MKRLNKTITPNCFPIKFHFSIGTDGIGELVDRIAESGKCKGSDIDAAVEGVDEAYIKAVHGLALNIGPNQGIWVRKANDLGTLVHECLHAVEGACTQLGIDDEEVRCYMVGWLIDEIKASPKFVPQSEDPQNLKREAL